MTRWSSRSTTLRSFVHHFHGRYWQDALTHGMDVIRRGDGTSYPSTRIIDPGEVPGEMLYTPRSAQDTPDNDQTD